MDVPILTPDQRVRVFVSSTLGELATERAAVRRAVERLHLLPVMFELGARPHPPRQLYRAYLAQSHVFLGIYWERYGWVAPGEDVSGLEDEYRLCGDLPRLVYVKEPAPRREPRLAELLARIQDDDRAAYKQFGSPRELARLVARDLAVLLSERFAGSAATVPVVTEAAHAPRAALPEQPTSFVGRKRELSELARLVADHRVVTLVGSGGAGKTRLAVEAARRLSPSFDGRVSLVELAAVATDGAAENLPRAVVDALGLVDVVSDGVVRDATTLLVRALRGPHTLLVFDNCEHVLDAAAALVARIVAECSGVRVLATSREPLAVPGETEVPIAPLEADNAIRLFAERAAAVRPGFTVTPQNRVAVEEICRRLDGLPLAIELAAARVKVLPPGEIAHRLDDRFRLLRAGPRTAEPRQQTLHAMVDWSYALLSPLEQRVFLRLGVFAGGIPLDGAETICSGGDVDPLDVLDLVARLVDKSLVLADYDEGGTPRFRLLETLRAYALERLRDHGEEWEDAHRRHAEYMADVAEAAWITLRGPDQSDWFARLDRDHDNVRAALGWAVTRDATLAQRIAAHMGWFWWLRGHAEEGENWLRAALDTRGHPPPPLAARTRAMLALLLGERGQAADAEKAAREALADAQDDDGEPLTLARVILALTLARRGEFDEAVELLDLAEASDDAWSQAASDVVRAALLAAHDRTALRPVALRAVERFSALGDRWGELGPRMLLAIDAEQHGDTDTAAAHYERNLEIARELGLRSYEAMALTHLGNLAMRTGDLDRAQDIHVQAVDMFTDVGSPTGAAFSRRALAAVAERQEDFARARALYQEILEQQRDTHLSLDAALSLARLGFLAERDGDLVEARARHLESLEITADLQRPAEIALALEGIAGVAAAAGDPFVAAQLLGGATSLRERSDVPVDDIDAVDVRRAYQRTRGGLDAETFDAAHLSGKKLNVTQLLDLARVPPGTTASKLGGPMDGRSESQGSPPHHVDQQQRVARDRHTKTDRSTSMHQHSDGERNGADIGFPTEVAGLAAAGRHAQLQLGDGDVFDLRIAPVAKQVADATVRMLAYNGSIPGPTVRVRQGSQIVVQVTNEGDMETTVHWHGLRLENKYDGVPHETQLPVPVGGTFTYRLTFPDAGLYWYHPHIREDYGQELGLYGNIIVDPVEVEYWPPVHREIILTLDDLLLEGGKIAPFSRTLTNYAAMGRFGNVLLIGGEPEVSLTANLGEVVRLYLTNTANTRVFNVALPGARLKLIGGDSGRYEREEFIETVLLAPSERAVVDVLFDEPGTLTLEHRTPRRTYSLATITVAEEPVTRPLATEFSNLRTAPELVAERQRLDAYLAAPPDKVLALIAEMDDPTAPEHDADVVYACPMHPDVIRDQPGSCPKCGMKLLPKPAPATYACPMHPEVTSDQPGRCPKCGMKLLPAQQHANGGSDRPETMPADGTDSSHDGVNSHHDVHSEVHEHAASDGIEWEDDMVDVNRLTTTANMRWAFVDRTAGADTKAIDWHFNVGDRVKIRLINEMDSDHPMHHPFHLHGAGRFLVLARNGIVEPNLVWKDTVLVRRGETVDILFDVTNPGLWMAHCHIAEHMQSGMMFSFTVAREPTETG